MKSSRRSALYLTGALALPALACPLQAADTSAAAPAPTSAASSPTPPKTAADTPRFGSFDNASPAVVEAVAKAQAAAEAIRTGNPSASVTPASVTEAVAQASAAIVQEGRVARSSVLADRQAALTRLKLAQSEQERQRIIEQLRVQTGQRMEEQRESARLVRDRLRELRVLTATTNPGS